MANIGKLSVLLSLDAMQFVQGMDGAGKSAKNFAGGLSATFAGLSAIQAAGGAALGTAEGLYAGFKSGLEEIVESGRKAQELGTDLKTLAAINLMAGSHAEVFDNALVRLNRDLAQAAMGSEEATAKFARFGLDANALLQMSLDKRIGAIGDKLAQLGTNKGLAVFEIFGREGAGVLADLEKGTAGVAAAMEKIKAHGGAGITEADVEKARQTQQSLTEMENSFNRIKLTLVSEFSPAVKGLADWIADIAGAQGGRMRDMFHNAAVSLVTGTMHAVDSLAQAAVYVHRMELGFEKMAGYAKMLALAQESPWAHKGALDARDDFEKWIEEQRKNADALGSTALGVLNQPALPDSPPPPPLAADKTWELTTAAGKLAERLHDQVQAFGMAGEAAERFKLAHEGATAVQLVHVDALLRERTALSDLTLETSAGLNVFQQFDAAVLKLNHLKDLGVVVDGFDAKMRQLNETLGKKVDAEAMKVASETASSFDKLGAQFDELNKMFDKGTISADQFALAAVKDFKDLAGQAEKIQHVGAVLQGSKEDYEVRLHADDQSHPADAQQRLERLQQENNRQQQELIRQGREMIDAWNRILKKG